MSHSPEPWIALKSGGEPWEHRVIQAADQGSVASMLGNTLAFREADAERIVAAINACRGIPTEELAKYPNGLDAVGLILLREYLPKRKIVIHNPIVEGGEVICIKDEV
jgi:hypothetical protein